MKDIQDLQDLYPVTIVKDRYGGCYSGALYTAWNAHIDEVPTEIEGSDIPCVNFWDKLDTTTIFNQYQELIMCGKGSTPDEAQNDLFNKLKK